MVEIVMNTGAVTVPLRKYVKFVKYQESIFSGDKRYYSAIIDDDGMIHVPPIEDPERPDGAPSDSYGWELLGSGTYNGKKYFLFGGNVRFMTDGTYNITVVETSFGIGRTTYTNIGTATATVTSSYCFEATFEGTPIKVKYAECDEDGNNIPDTYAKLTDLAGKIDATEKGANNGVASLDGTGKIPTGQLPGSVFEVCEYNSSSAFPAVGEIGKIYVAKDNNILYRWTGSAYVSVGGGGWGYITGTITDQTDLMALMPTVTKVGY